MHIPINDRYAMSADSLSWILREHRTRTDKDGELRDDWRPVAWYRSCRHLCEAVADRAVRESGATTVAEAVEAAQRIGRELAAMMASAAATPKIEDENAVESARSVVFGRDLGEAVR